MAREALLWLYFSEKKFDKSLEQAQILINSYPDNRFFLWALADVYFEMKEWDKSIAEYGKILKITKDLPNNNHPHPLLSRLLEPHSGQMQ